MTLCGDCFGLGLWPFVWGDGAHDCETCPWCDGGEIPNKKAAPCFPA